MNAHLIRQNRSSDQPRKSEGKLPPRIRQKLACHSPSMLLPHYSKSVKWFEIQIEKRAPFRRQA